MRVSRPIHLPQQASRRAGTVAHRGLSAWQRERSEMSDTIEAILMAMKEFAAPDRAILSKPGAVPRHAKIIPGHSILRGTSSHMSVMMLHAYKWNPKLFGAYLCPHGRGIIGMQIAHDSLWFEAIKPAKVIDSTLKRVSRLQRIEIADMLTKKCLPSNRDGDRVLEMSTHGKHRPKFLCNRERQRCVATRTAKNLKAIAPVAREHTNNGIVAGPFDRPVVDKEDIGDIDQRSESFFIVDSDGLPGAVAAGRYNRERVRPHKQMLYRRAWKHDAKNGGTLRNLGRKIMLNSWL